MPQMSLVPLLDAVLPYDRAPAEDEELVRRYLRRALPIDLPPGASDCVIAVVSVERHAPYRLLAEVVLFDGERALLELRGSLEPGAYPGVQWLAETGLALPFGWDGRARTWRRFPEYSGASTLYRDAFERLADEDAKAVARSERARRAAATRRRNRAAAADKAGLGEILAEAGMTREDVEEALCRI
ncbi:MAG: NAC family transcription factor [Methylorubrum extorquens]|jgi:hypothetical protein|uniref:hypothetical protein n=1 Tax=Methylorubrum extorquens TaxID=408 RepID=UPI002FEE17C2